MGMTFDELKKRAAEFCKSEGERIEERRFTPEEIAEFARRAERARLRHEKEEQELIEEFDPILHQKLVKISVDGESLCFHFENHTLVVHPDSDYCVPPVSLITIGI